MAGAKGFVLDGFCGVINDACRHLTNDGHFNFVTLNFPDLWPEERRIYATRLA